MISNNKKNIIINSMIKELDIPDSAYAKAKKRYEDLGDWFSRDESLVKNNDPHIFPQGSFRLGTVIHPINENDAYDLDLACKLRVGISKSTHTQEELKELVGKELRGYRIARQIKNNIETKHRCWRLEYQDDLSFHMDIIPCIPANEEKQQVMFETMLKARENRDDAKLISKTTIDITDDRSPNYKTYGLDWEISNPEGYALWFENRLKLFNTNIKLEKAQIDNIPVFKKKTPLQRTIQLLKRHRDIMFEGDEDVKPISVIITTIAARAYNGEDDFAVTLENIMSKMGNYINQNIPRVPNPVDPLEDFADRWEMTKYKHLNLETNFWHWLKQAQVDFSIILQSTDTKFLKDHVEKKFSLRLDESELSTEFNKNLITQNTTDPKLHIIDKVVSPKPWSKK